MHRRGLGGKVGTGLGGSFIVPEEKDFSISAHLSSFLS